MSRIETPIDIQTRFRVVCDAESQVDRHSEWMSDAEAMTLTDEKTLRVDSTMNVLTRVSLLTTIERMVLENLIAPTTIGVSHRGLVSGTGGSHIVETPAHTGFVWNESLPFTRYLGGHVAASEPILSRIRRCKLAKFRATLDDLGADSTTPERHA